MKSKLAPISYYDRSNVEFDSISPDSTAQVYSIAVVDSIPLDSVPVIEPQPNIPILKRTVNPYIAQSYQKHLYNYARNNQQIPLDEPRSVYFTPSSPVIAQDGSIWQWAESKLPVRMYDMDQEDLGSEFGEGYNPTYYYPPEQSYNFLPWSVIQAEYNAPAQPTYQNVEATPQQPPQDTAAEKQLRPKTTTSKPKVSTSTKRQVSASQQGTSDGMHYTIKKGDNLWNLAKKYLGNGANYTQIMKANGWTNPNQIIRPGDVIIIPGTQSTSVPQRTSNRVVALRDYKAPSVLDLIQPITTIPNIKKIKF